MNCIQKKYDLNFFGENSFLLGTFFLVSALPLGMFFFIISIIISCINNKLNPFHDKWNYPLFISSGIIIFSTLKNALIDFQLETSMVKSTIIFSGIINWIPLFFSFWAFQVYLSSETQRKLFIRYLIAGSIPLLISCILQYWFNVYGPFETMNGLIVWYQKPITGINGVSGLFSNQNYNGFWLSVIWPFSIFLLRDQNKKTHKIFLITISILIFIFCIFSNSRSSLLSLLFSIPLIFNIKLLILFISFISFILFIYFSLTNKLYINQNLLINIIPVSLIQKLSLLEYKSLMEIPRLEIFSKAILLISNKPLLGWGASTFASIYALKGGLNRITHTHNIGLELAYNFGIPLAITLCSFSIYLIFKCWEIVLTKKNIRNLNSYWIISLTIVLIWHINDITYFDGKISILIWILLAGAKCIIEENKKIKRINSNN